METTEADYMALCDTNIRNVLFTNMLKAFKKSAPIPKSVPKPADIKKSWKPAKHDANRDAAAASVYLVMDQDHDFKHAGNSWQGFLPPATAPYSKKIL